MADPGIKIRSQLRCAAVLLLALVAGCDQLSDVGKQKEAEPSAIATSIGEAFANDADGNLTMTVRSGADVVLSGKESQKGADDKGIPIIHFDWKQDPSDSVKVQLIYRTSNTVSFMAPQVTGDTTLHFKLTISDAKGAGDAADATVIVKSVRDADHFLQYLSSAPGGTFSMALATQTGISGAPSAGAMERVDATIRITKLLTFRDRDSNSSSAAATFTRVPIGTPAIQITGWATRLGSSASCSSPLNPVVRFSIPRLNLDEMLASVDDLDDPTLAAARTRLIELKSRYPEAVILSDVLEASDLSGDAVKLELQIDVMPTAGVSKPCLYDANDSSIAVSPADTTLASPSSTVIVPVESTSAKTGVAAVAGLWPVNATHRDSRESAKAYYKTIDAGGDKTTLNAWLATNGFSPNAAGYGADAHAVYTNDYDLGFGRDMYLKFGACDDGASGLPMQSRSGKCDVAAVVLNYPNLEAAAKKLNSFAAVAMEYSRVGGSGERFVKFYTFVPDTRDGVFKRALSLNFDRRGEQYMPQACIGCHAGTPGTYTPSLSGPGTYANGGDVKAAFLPWDLDSFLFSAGPNADPGFSRKSRDDKLRAKYTRDEQESQFRLLNIGAYLTMGNGRDQANNDDHRFDLGHELIEKWYGGLSDGELRDDSYDDSGVPDGWKSNVNANPVDSEEIYHGVFARNCRMCHTMHVPASGDPRTATVPVPVTPGTTTPTILLPACGSDSRLIGSSTGTTSQVPMGCYWEFAHAPNLGDRLSRNQMPLARRTSDRLWVSNASMSAGATLQEHLLSTQNLDVALPGTVSGTINTSPAGVDFGEWLKLDGSASRFASDVGWTVNACSGTPGNPGVCARAVPVVARDQLGAQLLVDDVATYQLTLDVAGTTRTQYVQITDKVLVLQNRSMNFQVGGQGPLPSVVLTPGNGTSADHSVLVTPGADLVILPSTCTVSPGCPADTAITVRSTATTAIGRSITVRVTDAGSNAVAKTATVAVSVLSTFTAQPLTITTVINANAATSTDLDVLSLARTAVARSDVTITGLSYTGPRSPLVSSFNGTILSYRPSTGFATHDKAGNFGAGTLETYSYQLRRPDTGEVSSSTITVPVRARVTFSEAKATWPATAGAVASCSSSCHAPSGAGSLAAAPKFGTSSVTYSNFIGGSLSANSNIAYVNVGDVESSGLLCYPQQLANCATGHDVTVASATLETVRRWIADGANNF